MRKIIAALQMSVDGFIEGPHGEMEWAQEEDEDTWKEMNEFLESIDTLVLGRGMYPVYEQYWLSVLEHPTGNLPMTNKPASKHEIDFAHFADKTPHIVLSKTLDKVNWKTTRIARDVEEIRKLKQAIDGKDIYVVGGAALVSSLMNEGLVDELRLMVNPIVLGGGKALFKDVKEKHRLKLVEAKPMKSGKVSITYSLRSLR